MLYSIICNCKNACLTIFSLRSFWEQTLRSFLFTASCCMAKFWRQDLDWHGIDEAMRWRHGCHDTCKRHHINQYEKIIPSHLTTLINKKGKWLCRWLWKLWSWLRGVDSSSCTIILSNQYLLSYHYDRKLNFRI